MYAHYSSSTGDRILSLVGPFFGINSASGFTLSSGVEDPKIVVTTSRDPSSRLQQFAKEFRLLIPNCQRINRGGYVLNDLVELCRGNEITDLVILHEHRGGIVDRVAASTYLMY